MLRPSKSIIKGVNSMRTIGLIEKPEETTAAKPENKSVGRSNGKAANKSNGKAAEKSDADAKG